MSGIEVAGLAFGVLPILIEVVKSYKDVSKKVRTLRHHSKELKSISEQLRVHNGIFLNEVRLLLRSIEAEEEVETMLDDAADQRWCSKRLNEKLRTVLQDSFEVCQGIIEETKETIEKMREELGKFDLLLKLKTKGESIKSTLKRLGGAIRIAFDKSRYDKYLANLRDRNGDLSALRSQIGAFQRQNVHDINACTRHRPLPDELQSIKNASQKLHEALCGAWCCDDSTHRGHLAKLCIDARVEEEVRLDLAISSHGPNTNSNSSLLSRSPIWLYVQSISTSKDEDSQLLRSKPALQNTAIISPLTSLTSCGVNVVKKKASSDLQQQPQSHKKSKRVHFADSCAQPKAAQPVSVVPPLAVPPHVNLCQMKSICRYLQQHCQKPTPPAVKRCIGYLETPQLYKHLFYFQDEIKTTDLGSSRSGGNMIYTVFDSMRHDVDDVLAVEDQLKLAHRTAIALLQYNDTPWMSDRWRLRDLSYFGPKDTLDDTAMQTLHLSSQIATPTVTATTSNTMDGIEQPKDAVTDQVRYGINNTMLFFLGVALLEIAHWKPIEDKMTARDLNNEVFAARRLAAGRAPLGPQYQKIAEKCLQCNFGFGTKLSSKGLKTAVYNDVVCELEGMIEKLTI